MNKIITLNGGKTLNFQFAPETEGGTAREPLAIKVRQIPVREYESGFVFAEDEIALVGFLCGKDKNWAVTLEPEIAEEILITGREVNAKGFFSYCQRRMELIQQQNAAMLGVMATMPPETLKLAMEKGLAMQQKSRSPILSPGFVSAPAA